jgi:hypothetical protein
MSQVIPGIGPAFNGADGLSTIFGALVYPSADSGSLNLTVTAQAVPFNAETNGYDISNWHDTVTNNTRLTVPSGVSAVAVMAQVSLSNNTGFYTFEIFKNGAALTQRSAQSDADTSSLGMKQIYLPYVTVTAGDYFEVFVSIVTDTSVNFTGNRCYLSAWKLA